MKIISAVRSRKNPRNLIGFVSVTGSTQLFAHS